MPQRASSSNVAVERVRIGSLKELDALIGQRLTNETPRTHWEDANTHFQFGSIEEALDALHDPFFRQFVPHPDSKPTMLREIKEFRRYSSDLNMVWDLIDRVSATLDTPLLVRRERERWLASFGGGTVAAARTPPVAICIAALRMTGIEVEFVGTELADEHSSHQSIPEPAIAERPSESDSSSQPL
jgi:hypothetical protein